MLEVDEIVLDIDYEESLSVNIKLHNKGTLQIGAIYRTPHSDIENNEDMLKIIWESELVQEKILPWKL